MFCVGLIQNAKFALAKHQIYLCKATFSAICQRGFWCAHANFFKVYSKRTEKKICPQSVCGQQSKAKNLWNLTRMLLKQKPTTPKHSNENTRREAYSFFKKERGAFVRNTSPPNKRVCETNKHQAGWTWFPGCEQIECFICSEMARFMVKHKCRRRRCVSVLIASVYHVEYSSFLRVKKLLETSAAHKWRAKKCSSFWRILSALFSLLLVSLAFPAWPTRQKISHWVWLRFLADRRTVALEVRELVWCYEWKKMNTDLLPHHDPDFTVFYEVHAICIISLKVHFSFTVKQSCDQSLLCKV